MTPTAMTAIAQAEFRAAGTDLSERRRSGVSTGPMIDISAAPETIGMHWGDDGVYASGHLRPSPPSPPIRSLPRPIRAWRLPRKVSRRRRSVIWRRWAATSRNVRAAGTTATRTSPASRKADRIVPHARAIISITWRSISAPASRRIPPPWPRRCLRTRRRQHRPAKRADDWRRPWRRHQRHCR